MSVDTIRPTTQTQTQAPTQSSRANNTPLSQPSPTSSTSLETDPVAAPSDPLASSRVTEAQADVASTAAGAPQPPLNDEQVNELYNQMHEGGWQNDPEAARNLAEQLRLVPEEDQAAVVEPALDLMRDVNVQHLSLDQLQSAGAFSEHFGTEQIDPLATLLRAEDQPDRSGFAAQTLANMALNNDDPGIQQQAARTLLNAPMDILQDLARGEVDGITSQQAGEIGQTADDPLLRQRLLESLGPSPAAAALDRPIAENLMQDINEARQIGQDSEMLLDQGELAPELVDEHRTNVERAEALDEFGNLMVASQLSRDPDLVDRVDRDELTRRIDESMQNPHVQESVTNAEQTVLEQLGPERREQLTQEQLEYMEGSDYQARLAMMTPEEREAAMTAEFDRLQMLDPTQVQNGAESVLRGVDNFYHNRSEGLTSTSHAEIDAAGIGAGGVSFGLDLLPHDDPGYKAFLENLVAAGDALGIAGATISAYREFASGDNIGGTLQLGQMGASGASLTGTFGAMARLGWGNWLARGSFAVSGGLMLADYLWAESEQVTFMREQGLLLE
jgi:hypothetical protein